MAEVESLVIIYYLLERERKEQGEHRKKKCIA